MNPRTSRILRQTLFVLLAVSGVALAVLAVYLVNLDRQIRARFNGVRWQLPAQVFASPFEMYAGEPIGPAGLRRELVRLGYREDAGLPSSGTYALAGSQVSVRTRPFAFWDGVQPEQRLVVRFDGDTLQGVTDPGGKDIAIARLDPLLVGSIYPTRGGEDRILVRLDEVPPLLRNGLIAIEDQHFYDHHGISLKGLARAAYANMRAGQTVQGASTITQQLVKNFFLTNERSFRRKFREIWMSLLLETHYSKDQILEAYMNEIFMGQDGDRAVHGFGLASQLYFNKPPAELRPSEMALLVTVVRGASMYDPRRHPEVALKRRNLILNLWAERGLMTPADAEAATRRPLGLSDARSGLARYPAFVEVVKKQLLRQYNEDDLTGVGLRIFTTLSPRTQEILEDTIAAQLPKLEKIRRRIAPLQGAGVITTVEGGEVLAIVGARDPRVAGFNRAVDSERSIGSLAKPFVYATALAMPDRFNLLSRVQDVGLTWRQRGSEPWRPQNYDHREHGAVPLYKSLAHSYNLGTVWLGREVGLERVRQTLKAVGLPDPPTNPSLMLGAMALSPFEVAQMYNTIAAGGFRNNLTTIREVVTKEGKAVNRFPMKTELAIPEGAAYLTTWAMRKVMREGTAAGAYATLPKDLELAGKTGTTDDARDSWFAGFGGNRVAVVWVGRDDNKPIGLTGGQGALPVWTALMKTLRPESLDTTPPDDIEEADVSPYDGRLAAAGCASMQVPYVLEYAPKDTSSCGAVAAPSDDPEDALYGEDGLDTEAPAPGGVTGPGAPPPPAPAGPVGTVGEPVPGIVQ